MTYSKSFRDVPSARPRPACSRLRLPVIKLAKREEHITGTLRNGAERQTTQAEGVAAPDTSGYICRSHAACASLSFCNRFFSSQVETSLVQTSASSSWLGTMRYRERLIKLSRVKFNGCSVPSCLLVCLLGCFLLLFCNSLFVVLRDCRTGERTHPKTAARIFSSWTVAKSMHAILEPAPESVL